MPKSTEAGSVGRAKVPGSLRPAREFAWTGGTILPSSLLVIYHLMHQAPSGILLIVTKLELILTMIPLVHKWNGLVVSV